MQSPITHATTSRDGTRIAYYTVGSGPALLIVGGALADHHAYAPLADALASRFTVCTFDRRGRGRSGDSLPYTPEREVEDVTAVLACCQGPVRVYGHSAGAALALRTAASNPSILRMVLADPPFAPRGPHDELARTEHAAQAAQLQALVEQGDLEGTVRCFLGDFGLSPSDLDALLASPEGSGMMALAATLPYDYAMLDDGLVPVARAAVVHTPTWLVAPGASCDAARQLAEAMPNARLATLDAPTHELSPADLAASLIGWFQE